MLTFVLFISQLYGLLEQICNKEKFAYAMCRRKKCFNYDIYRGRVMWFE